MPSTLHPGLYMQETQPATQAIQPSATSIAGFVGVAQKGPVNVATLVTSWADFTRKFGTFISNSQLAYAVFGFFLNGGTQCYIVRTTKYTAGADTSVVATIILKDGAGTPLNSLTVNASSSGIWGNSISVQVASASYGSNYYKLIVLYQGTVVETFDNVTNLSTDPNFVQAIVNNVSNYISVTTQETTNPAIVAATALATGADGLAGIADADYIGTSAAFTGIYALDKVVGGVNLIAVPGITTVAVHQGIQTYVEGKLPQTIFGILDSPLSQTVTQIQTYRQTTASFNTANAALFYPNIVVSDPIGVGTKPTKIIAPSGHIAGLFARTDASRGVFKAPAGLSATLLGALDVESVVSDNDQDILNPIGVNVIRTPVAGSGIVVFGSRTLTTAAPQYTYIPVRRTIQFIESSIKANLSWAVFEPNNQLLWSRIQSSVASFLTGIWKDGGLAGTKTSDAFQVVCDSSNNTQITINQGQVLVDIAVAPVKPGEFIIFRIGINQ